MVKLCLLLALCGFCAAASVANRKDERAAQPQPMPIVRSVSEQKSDGSYFFAYEAADGSYREEVGIVKHAGTDYEELEVAGTYRYYDTNGAQVEVSYVADKNGFVPMGTNIARQTIEAVEESAGGAPSRLKLA